MLRCSYSGSTITGNSLSGTSTINASANSVISSNAITSSGAGSGGITISGDYVTVSNNSLTNASATGPAIAMPTLGYGHANISGNTINWNSGSATGRGIYLNNSSNNTISNNTIKNTYQGIFVGYDSDYNNVTNNYVEACADFCIGSFSNGGGGSPTVFADYNLFDGNTVKGGGYEGMVAAYGTRFNTFSNNLITDTGVCSAGRGGNGIFAKGSAANTVISNNTVYNLPCATAGIYMRAISIDGFNPGFANTTVDGNKIYGQADVGSWGIHVYGPVTNTVLSNNLLSNLSANQQIDNIANTPSSTVFVNQSTGNNGSAVLNKAADSANAFQIQNTAGASVLNVNTATPGATVGGTLAVTGTINTNLFTSTALTFSGVNPVISASTANTGLTVQAPGTGTLTLNTVGAGTVNVGTTNTTTLGLGSAASATTLSGATINVGNTSTSALSLGNTSGTSLFTGSTLSLQSAGNVVIGTSDTTGTLLVLDTKTSAGDPTGVNGATYYNSSANKFRCYEAGAWVDCIGAGGGSGDNITVNAAAATDANFIDTTATGTVAGTTFTLNTAPAPDTIAVTISNASASVAGVVTTGIQTLAGDKTLTGNTVMTGTLLQKSDSASAFILQDSTGAFNNLVFDSSTNHLKVYDHTAPRTAYADIYYSGGAAVFTASTGTTQIGSGTGSVTISLTNNSEQFNFAHSGTNATGSDIDFYVGRNLTGTTNNLQGAVAKIEDLSTFSTGSSAPDVLYVNQNNTSATGNLIVAKTGGSTTKFAVSTAGNVTVAGNLTVASTLLNADATNSTVALTSANTSTSLLTVTNNTVSATTAGLLSVTANGLTTGNGVNINHTTSAITTGSLLTVNSTAADALTTGALLTVNSTGNFTTTANTAGLLNVSATASAAGTLANIANSFATQTTSTLLNVVQTGTTTGYTGNVVNFTGSGTTGSGANLLNLNFASNTAAGSSALNISGGTTGAAIKLAATGNIIDLASGTAGNTAVFKLPTLAAGTCTTGVAEGLIFKDTGGTQRGHACIDSGTPLLKFFASAFNATSTDVAENYSDAANNLEPGDLVSLDQSGAAVKSITKATTANSSQLFGVISTAPGVLLSGIDDSNGGTDLSHPKPVALTGRIPTKVNTQNGNIAVGDYLTISSTPGVAMKSLGGGMVIGRALQSYSAAGTGKIEVAAQNFYYSGISVADVLQNNSISNLTATGLITTNNLSVTGTATINNLTVTGSITTQALTIVGLTTTGDLNVVNLATTHDLTVTNEAKVQHLTVAQGITLGDSNEDPTVSEIAHPITKRFKASKPIAAGAVVVLDTTAGNGWVTTAGITGSKLVIGVAVGTATNTGDLIEVAIGGTAKVSVQTVVAIGDLLHSDLAEGKASAAVNPVYGEVIGKTIGTIDVNGQVLMLVTLQ
jgi:parallel beta-helix repeat protein